MFYLTPRELRIIKFHFSDRKLYFGEEKTTLVKKKRFFLFKKTEPVFFQPISKYKSLQDKLFMFHCYNFHHFNMEQNVYKMKLSAYISSIFGFISLCLLLDGTALSLILCSIGQKTTT